MKNQAKRKSSFAHVTALCWRRGQLRNFLQRTAFLLAAYSAFLGRARVFEMHVHQVANEDEQTVYRQLP